VINCLGFFFMQILPRRIEFIAHVVSSLL